MGLVSEVKTLGTVASLKMAKPSFDKVYVVKQNVKSNGDA